MQSLRPYFLSIVGLTLLTIAFVSLLLMDRPLSPGEQLTIETAAGETVAATYYPGTNSVGMLLLPGFGGDQVQLRSITRELVVRDVSVLTLDYSGHGRSPGGLTLDNTSTDRLAGQVQAAMDALQQQSGLPAGQIAWIGHSLGGRVAVQSSVLGPQRPGQLYLLGAQINLGENTQAEFFTGNADAGIPWVQELGPETPPVPLLLLTGSWEDILTVEGAQLLMTQLCDAPVQECTAPVPREWRLYPRLVHNYEIYSPRLINDILQHAGLPDPDSGSPQLRIWLWVISAAGLFITAGGLLKAVPDQKSGPPALNITDPRRYLAAKFWLWLPALPLVLLVMIVYAVIPLPNPTFNLIYGGFLGGYGLLLWLLMRRGKMPGMNGRIQSSAAGLSGTQLGKGALVFLALLGAATLLYRSGLGQVPPVGVRLVWVGIFTPLTAVGFYLGALENRALRIAAPERSGIQILAGLSGLVPFFLYALLLAVLGSISGLIAAIVGIVVLLFSLLLGELVSRHSGSPLFAAVCQSIFIFWLLLPAGALFQPFLG